MKLGSLFNACSGNELYGTFRISERKSAINSSRKYTPTLITKATYNNKLCLC